ncbi:MAG: PEP/pyruvate-binding domain-containing protein, partial [Mycobacteriales bacterium]
MQTTDDVGLVLGLPAAADAGAARVGVKAATLAVLARAGLAVPDALVLTAEAAEAHLAAAAPGSGGAAEAVLSAPLPAAVDGAVQAIAAHFGDATLAVRSSAAAEDLPDASFAGQYDTVLHVRGLPALRDAVRRCWASAHGDRVRAYRGSRGPAPAIAVLVQRQVDPDVAGVAFTVNPVTGDRGEVLVSAVPGLGDALVSGEQQPDEWTVRGPAATAVRVEHQALAAEQARAVAALARQIEEVLGGPQDVEWAMAGGRLLVLQARPITALPRRPVADLPPGTWMKDVEHYPEPFTALGASVAIPAVSAGLSAMFATWGGLLERLDLRTVGGEAYAQAVPVGGHAGPQPPWWVLAVLARVVPPLRRRVRTAERMVRPEVFDGQLEEWNTHWKPEIAAESARLAAVDLGRLDDRTLDQHVGQVADLAGRALHVHFHLIPLYTVPPYELVEVCRTLLGWDELDALTLLAGASETSSAPARALARVAAGIAAHPAARAVVERAETGMAAQLLQADTGSGEAFAQWCDEYGARCVHDDPGSPTYTERPWLLAGLLRDALAAADAATPGPDERAAALRAEATARARTARAGRPRADRDRFEHTLATALRFYPLREDTVFSLARVSGCLRLAALEAGRRLTARGDLDRPEDAVQL